MPKTIIAIGDCHFPFANAASLFRIEQMAKQIKPQVILQIGDAMDAFSFGKYPRTHNLMTPNQELVIMIQDNGRGLKAIDSLRASEIINDRLYILNKVNKTSSSYLIRERQSGGVSVEIYLPLITKAFAEQLKNEAEDYSL